MKYHANKMEDRLGTTMDTLDDKLNAQYQSIGTILRPMVVSAQIKHDRLGGGAGRPPVIQRDHLSRLYAASEEELFKTQNGIMRGAFQAQGVPMRGRNISPARAQSVSPAHRLSLAGSLDASGGRPVAPSFLSPAPTRQLQYPPYPPSASGLETGREMFA